MGEKFALLQCDLAALHGLDEADFFIEIARNDVLHELVGIAALAGGGVSQLGFEFRCEVYFHAPW